MRSTSYDRGSKRKSVATARVCVLVCAEVHVTVWVDVGENAPPPRRNIVVVVVRQR